MSLAWLTDSLRVWRVRERVRKALHARAQRDLDRARAAGHHPRRALVDRRDKRTRQLEEARQRIALRQRQIVSKKRANRKAAAATTGVGRYDGVPVANVAIPYLEWARANGWKGRLVSGWRDPNYSESLCRRMCGAPRCPGRCAGTSSNHVGTTKERFAIDVSDYATFGRLMRSCPLRPRIYNALGAQDPVHMSPNGQ
jgi:hypothetical protein